MAGTEPAGTEPAGTGPAGTLLEIDLGVIAGNYRTLCTRHAGPVAGVVKADAYGLGAMRIAPALHAAGCRHFFTAHLSEALAIRPLLADSLVAVLNTMLPGDEGAYVAQDVAPVLGSLDEIRRWQLAARGAGRPLQALLHVDTGMNRLGLDARELAVLAEEPGRLDGLRLRFVMTHLVSAELAADPENRRQHAAFAAARARLPPMPASLANSSGIFLGADFASDLARPGAALYGINPLPGRANPMRLAVRLTAPVLQVRDIAAGAAVGYNAVWRSARPSRIATLGVGYADGWSRSRQDDAVAIFDGAPVPLVGRVSMDLTTYDVTDHPAIVPGSRLELLGPGLSAEAIGAVCGTNGYEVLTSLGQRYRRVWT